MPIPSVGAVPTPTGFVASSAQGQVYLTWNSTPLATIYYVSRSSDGVTYAELGPTTLLNYSDTTGVIGTTYYYYLQAGNGTFSSQPTSPQTALALLPGQTTVGNLSLLIRQECNKENSPFITGQELNSYINNSFKELYDILVQKFGDDYEVATPYTYTTAQNQQLYPLPNDFYKLLGVEVALNPADPSSWVTLHNFEFVQRNLLNYPNQYTFYGVTNLRYRLNGTNLMVIPFPSGGQTLRIWYAPRPNQLLTSAQIVDGISGWEEYIVVDCCIKILGKEESDTSLFLARKAALLQRIEEASANRNIGDPETVSDSRTRNFAWSDDSGWGGNGGIW